MKHSVALQRYLDRHIEHPLPEPPENTTWKHCLIIPAFREDQTLVEKLTRLPKEQGATLIILAINRPYGSTKDANRPLLEAVSALPKSAASCKAAPLYCLSRQAPSRNKPGDEVHHLLVVDLDHTRGPLPEKQGVGLARKYAADIAVRWYASGALETAWIHCSDADALWPEDYFSHLTPAPERGAAAVFPFYHAGDPHTADTTQMSINAATALYELRLHHYVLGLEYAESPYAYHTLGSAIAFHIEHYVQVRGFPTRNAGEDFYLLNKLAKTGKVIRLSGTAIQLHSRASDRVPFGTGPAVMSLSEHDDLAAAPLFYNPDCYVQLKCVLRTLIAMYDHATDTLHARLRSADLQQEQADEVYALLQTMGVEKALTHCQAQGKRQQDYERHLHQWFDGFRTLKFIHGLRDTSYPMLSLNQLNAHQHPLWPATQPTATTAPHEHSSVEFLLEAIRKHWQWRCQSTID